MDGSCLELSPTITHQNLLCQKKSFSDFETNFTMLNKGSRADVRCVRVESKNNPKKRNNFGGGWTIMIMTEGF